MKVLVLSHSDSGGGVGRLARAINEHPDHQARACRWPKRDVLEYETSAIWRPDKKCTIQLMRWADAVIVTGLWWNLPKKLPWGSRCIFPPGAPRKPVVVNYRGTPYRRRRKIYDEWDVKAGVVQTGNFLDLTLYGREKAWLPVPVWVDDLKDYRSPRNDGIFHIAQAVTIPGRFKKKSTRTVKEQLQNLEGVELDIITGVTNEECLARLGRADVVVTGFKNSFGNSGLEALAMDIPIIANGFPALIAKYNQVIGFLPFAQTEVGQLRKLIVRMRDDSEFYNDVQRKGTEYLERFHSPHVVAEKAVEFCKTAKPIRYEQVQEVMA